MPNDRGKKAAGDDDAFKKQLQEYVKKIGSLGGKKRSQSLKPERRREIARNAVLTRWANARRGKKTNK